MDLDLSLVSAFVVLAEEGSFGRAAQRLHLTTSAVSKRIQRLESQLGVPLLVRDPIVGTRLAPAGVRFLGAAEAVLRQSRAAARAARAEDSAATVRLGFPDGAQHILRRLDLAGAARNLRQEAPGMRLVTLAVPFGDLARALPDHRVDVLLSNSPLRQPGVVSEPLALTEDRVALVPSGHPLAGGRNVGVDDLFGHPCLYAPHGPAEWMEPFWLADVRPRREAALVAIDENHNDAAIRHVLTNGAIMVNLASAVGPLPAELSLLAISDVAPVRMHLVYRAADRRGVLAAALAGLRRPPTAVRPRPPGGRSAEAHC